MPRMAQLTMKTKKDPGQTLGEGTDRNLRIHRSISIYAEQEQKLIAAAEQAGDVSSVIRELIDRGLDDTGARRYMDARDRGIQFAEDVEQILKAAGIECARDAKVNGAESHRTDILATFRGKRVCVELKSSGRPEKLELALGSALILKSQSGLPACVCVPYIVESGVQRMYGAVGVGIATPETVVDVVRGLAGAKA